MAGQEQLSPSELRQQREELTSIMANLDAGSLGDLKKDNKRWLIIGIVINTVMSPALRGYVKTKMDQLYQILNNSNSIGSQQYPNQLQFHLGTFLNYEAINNNKTHGRQQQKKFDYNVKTSVDLSKLFLETNMAKYQAIDESCDLSALLGIIIKSSICPGNAQQSGKKLRDDVRNSWAHCMFSEWNETKYTESFDVMEQLFKDLGFQVQEEKNLIADLDKWRNKGEAFIKDTTTTKVLKQVTDQTSALIKAAEVIAVDTPEKILKLKEELLEAKSILLNHGQRIHQLELTTREHEARFDTLEYNIQSLKAQQKIDIGERKRDENMFTCTRATKYVADEKKKMNTGQTLSKFDFLKIKETLKDYCTFIPIFCKMSAGAQLDHMHELSPIKQMIQSKMFMLCALVLCVMFRDDGFHEKFINLRTTQTKVQQKITKIAKQFKINLGLELDRKKLADTFNLLNGTYIKKTGRKFSISHDIVHNMVSVFCGQALVELFIEFAPSSFITEQYRFSSVFTDQHQEQDGSFVYLHIDTEKMYFDRIFKDVKTNDMNSLLFNRQLKEPMYRDKVMKYILQNKDSCKQVFIKLDRTGIKQNRKFNNSDNTKTYLTTPMIQATKAGVYELVEFFIQCKFNVSKTDSDNHSPLFYAYENDFMNIVDLLISNGVENDETMFLACYYGDINRVKIVIGQNADVVHCSRFNSTPLYAACEGGHANVVQLLLDRKVDVSKGSRLGQTPLYAACERGHTNVVQLLLDRKVDVSKGGRLGQTPLYVACEEGHIDIVKLLLENNADETQTGPYRQTPFYAACKGGHIDIVKLLLDKNVDGSQPNQYGKTPLHAAFDKGHTDIVGLLLDRNVDALKPGPLEPNSLKAAFDKGHTDIVQLLLDRNVDVSQPDSPGPTLLNAACEGGHIKIVQLLLDKNVNASWPSRNGETPLYAACKSGHIDIVQLLLDRNVDVSHPGPLKQTPFYAACEKGHIDIVQLLLDRNVDVSMPNKTGWTPLCAACKRGHIDIVQLLLDRNVDVSHSGLDRQTPLYAACEGGHIDIVELLLDKNVDVSEPDRYAETLLFAACEKGHTDIVQLLIDRNIDISQPGRSGQTPRYAVYIECDTDVGPLFSFDRNVDVSQPFSLGRTLLNTACKKGHTDIVQLLLDRNVDVSQPDPYGQTLLCAACEGGHSDIVQLLLDRNVDVSQSGQNGQTPIYAACKGGHTDIVQLLLDRNVDVLEPSGPDRKTPLYAACKKGYTDIVQLLLDRNVDVLEPSGPDRKTPLYAACKRGHTDIFQLLLDRNVKASKLGPYGETLLHVACNGGHNGIVKILLDRNENVS